MEQPHYTLDQVFNEAQIPTVTYVTPAEAKHLRASLKTRGKHVTLVGASGSGKSTVAEKTLQELFPAEAELYKFSGRSYTEDRSFLTILGKSGFAKRSVIRRLPASLILSAS
jgi:adenylylsulfate kinase-like enzyme